MKKVISALTAAAMCASMTASLMTASAVYKTGDVGYEMRVVSAPGATVDGSTVTFASAADAKGAEITIQTFLLADTSDPSVQQIGMGYTTNSTSVKLKAGLEAGAKLGENKTYTSASGKEFTTDVFVCTFDYLSRAGKWTNGSGIMSYAHSDDWPDGFVGNGDKDVMIFQWASNFGDSSRANYKDTAAFLGAKSDTFPLNQFSAKLADDIAEGTYTIEFFDEYTNPETGVMNAMYVNVDGKNTIKINDTNTITIKVGNASDPKPTDPPVKPTDPPVNPTDPPVKPTEPPVSGDAWTWYIEDATLDLKAAEESGDYSVTLELHVMNDPGIYTYQATMLMEGGSVDKYGFVFDVIDAGDAYNFGWVTPNVEKGIAGASDDTPNGDQVAANGAMVAYYTLWLDDPSKVSVGDYEISIDPSDLFIANFKEESLASKVTLKSGTLHITNGDEPKPTEVKPTEVKPTEVKPTEVKPTEVKPTNAPSGDYLYGDVNENGKVELVDIVMLNRALTGYADQQLTDRAIVNANCSRKGESDADTKKSNLDGKDSIAILKYLIELVAELPIQE